MRFLTKTITVNEKDLTVVLARLQQRLDAYDRFEDEVRDIMDFMEHDGHYIALNEALGRLRKDVSQ